MPKITSQQLIATIYRFDDLSSDILWGAHKACIHSAMRPVAFLADSLCGWRSFPEDTTGVSLPLSGGSVDDISALTFKGYSFVIGRLVSPVLV